MTPPEASPRTSVEEHKGHAPRAVCCVVCTISDSKTPDTDESGRLLRAGLAAAGHHIARYTIVRDEPLAVQAVVREACADQAIQAVVFTGGTGITSRDRTYEAIDGLLDKRLPGFGELFRMLSYQEIGAAAMLSRAQAGVSAGRIIFSLPGAPAACRLALERLILPELPHLVREVNR
jgi:molybdenum cofactor biosynthesis protein B